MGTFATVFRGAIRKKRTEAEVEVAVKTTKSCSPTSGIKGLLSEIKVLSYLGRHENVVGMFGAYTKEIKRGLVILNLQNCKKNFNFFM